MSARQMIDIAAASGIRLAAEGEKLIAECERDIPDAIVAGLKRHKVEILNELKQLETAQATAETILLDALHAGVEIRPIGGKVTITGTVPPELQARLDEYWDEILSLFAAGAETVPQAVPRDASAPSAVDHVRATSAGYRQGSRSSTPRPRP
jgi:hypothetical protein